MLSTLGGLISQWEKRLDQIRTNFICRLAHNLSMRTNYNIFWIFNNRYSILQYYTIFFKIRTRPKNIKNWQGGLPKSFFIDRTPPLPPPYCAIALLLKNNHSYICPDTFILRCPPIGSFYHIFWTLLLGLHILQ